MKKIFYYLTYVMCSAAFAIGCAQGGTEFGNPSKLNISVLGYQSSQLQASQLQAAQLQAMGMATLTVNDLTIDVAQVVLGRLKFLPFSVCATGLEGEDETELTGPFVVDLLQTATIDALEGVTVPDQLYCRIEVRLEKLEGNIMDNSIVGRSVLIQGTRADATPFQLSLEIDEEFKLENETTGFEVDGTLTPKRLFIAFDLDQWFDGVDLSDPGVEISSDGQGGSIIFIDDGHNTVIHEQIIKNIELSSELFEDKDNDDMLDQAEQADPLAQGETLP